MNLENKKLIQLGKTDSPLLWVVCYVNQLGSSPLVDEALRDLTAAFEGGADGAVLINEWCSLSELEHTLSSARKEFPRNTLGVNYLGDDAEPYGYRDSFRLAREHELKIVWTDFSGVDQITEKPDVSLHSIQEQRLEDVFYCSGIHMKYSTLRRKEKTIERSALQAMGWVDGIIVTGPKTGTAVDPDVLIRTRKAVGTYPVGVASGVSAENAHQIRNWADFCLVASSLQDENKRIVKQKVKALKNALRRANEMDLGSL